MFLHESSPDIPLVFIRGALARKHDILAREEIIVAMVTK